MKTISLDTPAVRMKPRHQESDMGFDELAELPCGIDQRDIEDLQTLARWYESSEIKFADIDDVFSNFDQLKFSAS
jgi:hypothetical protein